MYSKFPLAVLQNWSEPAEYYHCFRLFSYVEKASIRQLSQSLICDINIICILFILFIALCLASSSVRWCTISNEEQEKCQRLKQECFSQQLSKDFPELICVRKTDHQACITAIKVSEADAITLDAGLILEASLNPYYLKPVVAELHSKVTTSYHAIVVTKKGTISSLEGLRGSRSCHTGFKRSAGWLIPIGTLVSKNLIQWSGTDSGPIEKAVEVFFGSGCPTCFLTYTHCCLLFFIADSVEERSKYELLCDDGSRRPVEEYESCYWARVASHAVVARSVDGRADKIWALLSYALEQIKQKQSRCQLFKSPQDSGKDLLFKDSAVGLIPVPQRADAELYLGPKYCAAIQILKRGGESPDTIKWCAVGKAEKAKCDAWSAQSSGVIQCAVAETTEDCLIKIIKREADAITLDGGHIFTAGKCGLVPVLTEIPRKYKLSRSIAVESTGYFAVAVAKTSDTDVNWNTLRGKKSCHTGVGRTAGWNIPMGLINSQNNLSCHFDTFFKESCAPGAPLESTLCKLCKGSGGEGGLSEKYKCKPNSNEIYYSYAGALRCLIEGGQVAFVKQILVNNFNHFLIGQNKPAWASGVTPSDFVLLNKNGERCHHDEYERCHLAQVCNHAVVSRPERAEVVKKVVLEQQKLFGSQGTEKDVFHMFQSDAKDSLFKDGTECLAVPNENTYEAYLGEEYLQSLEGFTKCLPSECKIKCRRPSPDIATN
uniref:Transferrin-like domain-containing protein n=1 Tax=Pseudonaja textilis TaxID=8673 RepID=A0A670ZXC4_PSETE